MNFFYDSGISILLLILGFIICMFAQIKISYTYAKYKKIKGSIEKTGEDVATEILKRNGLEDIQVNCIAGNLTDHYSPGRKEINLSEDVYSRISIASLAVAAHECGHVIQHATGYLPLKMRTALVPAVSFSSNIVSWVLLAGVIFINIFPALLWIGIALFALTTLFSFITLPVEVNASSRAVAYLDNTGIASYETRPMAQDALKWAAYTYVIAALVSLATLVYYIMIGTSRR